LDLNKFKAPGESNSSGNPASVPGLRLVELMAAARDLFEVNHAAKPVFSIIELPHDYFPRALPEKTV
jgi:hypothetical protein